MGENSKKISTESYKGVRDFYPDDMYIHNYILETMARAVERFGYVEYGASVLESSELYEAKSGEEIVNEQTYTFTDRGDRSVTLRPEMTPTIARMIAAKKRDLAFPLRWYSTPNLFRYERPQRGRLREHWQLNVDLFGATSPEADAEIIMVAKAVMDEFGAKKDQYQIKVNSRKILNHLFSHYNLSEEEAHGVAKLLDRKNKISVDEFRNDLQKLLETKANVWEIFFAVMYDHEYDRLPNDVGEHESFKELAHVMHTLRNRGIQTEHDYSIVRGFDYYTGIVFEVYDAHPDNNRSMFGGGRYDDLLTIFGGESLPAVGFGMGDVTMEDFLRSHDLLPNTASPTDLYLCVLNGDAYTYADTVASELRTKDINVAIDYTEKKAGDQVKIASKLFVPFVICIGEDEVNSNILTLKNMQTGEETKCTDINDVVRAIKGKEG